MSVRVNLLPDLHQQKQREQSRRQTATVAAVVVCAAAIGVVVLLAIYDGAQKFTINDLQNKIRDKKTQLSNYTGLTDALTSQKAQAALAPGGLYDQRVYFSKFFAAYAAAAPTDVSLSSLVVDNANQLTISGITSTYASVTKLAAAMTVDNTVVGANAKPSNKPYFTSVNVTQASRDSTGKITFTLQASVEAGATSGN